MPAINSRCRQPHKPSFLLLDSFRPVFRQVLKSCTFLFFMLSGLLKPHNHPSLIPLISENQPFPAYSLLSFRECSPFKRGLHIPAGRSPKPWHLHQRGIRRIFTDNGLSIAGRLYPGKGIFLCRQALFPASRHAGADSPGNEKHLLHNQ